MTAFQNATFNNKFSFTREIAFSVTAVLASLVIWGTFINISCFNNNPRALFLDLVYGKANRPYVSRVLVPGIIRSLVIGLPASVQQSVNRQVKSCNFLSSQFVTRRWESDHSLEYLTLCFLLYLSILGYLYAFRYMLDGIYTGSQPFSFWVPILSLVGLTIFFPFNYIYDLPEVFLFTLGLAFMVHRRWAPFLLTYTLACLNKETSVLLVMVFCLYFWDSRRMPRSCFLALLILQTGIFLFETLTLWSLFAGNPGGAFEIYLWPHIQQLLRPHSLPEALAFIILPVLVFHRWRAKSLFLRNAFWIFVPLFSLFVPFGYMGEIRVFYEVYPVIFLLIAQSTAIILGSTVNAQDAEISSSYRSS